MLQGRLTILLTPFVMFQIALCGLSTLWWQADLWLSLMRYRLEVIAKWRGWLKQLLGKERELHRSLEADVGSVISKKNVLLMEKIATSLGWQDQNIVSDMCEAFDLVGTPEPSGVFAAEPNLPSMSVSVNWMVWATRWSKLFGVRLKKASLAKTPGMLRCLKLGRRAG